MLPSQLGGEVKANTTNSTHSLSKLLDFLLSFKTDVMLLQCVDFGEHGNTFENDWQ